MPTRSTKAFHVLALLAVGLVVADPALDRVGHALGGQAQLQARAELDLAAFEDAADVGDVGGDRVLADLDRRAVEADVGRRGAGRSRSGSR